ncbi:MAG TPA: tRNA(Ile)-lysidine synthetase, partial [Halieaceae bacterium]|nr:tRNA(Ile)-lysidine synthetase [Halieaceae bacterium]
MEAALAPWRSARRWWVAFSGGLDSTVLLHLLCAQRSAGQTPPISAVHINHQLHPAAEQWQQRAGAFCAALDVPLKIC